MKKIDTLGILELQVMLAVKKYPSQHGAHIHRVLEGVVESISVGSVYTSLDRLKVKGFLKKEFREPTNERGGCRTYTFSLTKKGLRMISQTLTVIDGLR